VADHRRSAPGRIAQQVAWLLRVNRIFGANGQFTKGVVFAAAFPGGCWSGSADVSKISRWETGHIRVPYLAVRRYEELLGLPANSLVSTIDTICRYLSGNGDFFVSTRNQGKDLDAVIDDLEVVADKALSGGLMTGVEWDALNNALGAELRLVVIPRSAWAEISGRLLSEMVIADGLAWTQRFEALNRLLAHPMGQRAAIDACASLGSDRASQVVVEAVSALDGSGHRDASRHVLSQLKDSTSGPAFYGALLACIRKIRFAHFTDTELRVIGTVVADLLTGPCRHDDAQTLAAELFRQLPTGLRVGAGRQLQKEKAVGGSVKEVLATGRLATAGAAVIAGRVADSVIAEMADRATSFRDKTLRVLIDDVLFSPVLDVRLYTAMLIQATPYREPLARSLTAEMAKPETMRRADLAATIVGCLRIIGGPEERPIIERLILASGMPPSVTAAAAHAIGHIGGTSTDPYWSKAIGHHSLLWHRHGSPAVETVLRDLIYGLGMSRNETMLARIREDASLPWPVRSAASWWLGLPRRTYESARN
jgi:hypothetical protein